MAAETEKDIIELEAAVVEASVTREIPVVKAGEGQTCALDGPEHPATAAAVIGGIPICAACAGTLAGRLTTIATAGRLDIDKLLGAASGILAELAGDGSAPQAEKRKRGDW